MTFCAESILLPCRSPYSHLTQCLNFGPQVLPRERLRMALHLWRSGVDVGASAGEGLGAGHYGEDFADGGRADGGGDHAARAAPAGPWLED